MNVKTSKVNALKLRGIVPFNINFALLILLSAGILMHILLIGISNGGTLMAIALFSVIIGGGIARRIHPLAEAYFETIVICFLLYNCYYFYVDLNILPLVGLVAIFVQRVTMFTFNFRYISLIWSIVLYILPLAVASLVVIDISPRYQIPLPNTYEMKLAGVGMLLISTSISFQTVFWFRKTIKNIEKRESKVKGSYKQVLELNQILSHNLRTPLANALGQLEIAERTDNYKKYVHQVKKALVEVTVQTSSVNNAKKAFEGTNNVNEFLLKWKEVYKHELVQFQFLENKIKYEMSEEVAIALAVSFDIFVKNSFEASANEVIIKVKEKASTLKIELLDNGKGASPHIIEMFGKPMTSLKEHGTGIGTYLAQRLLLSAGVHVSFSNRENTSGFKVGIEVSQMI